MGQTLFIIFILGFGSIMFTSDANDLVILPIERMIRVINMLALDPLSHMMQNVGFSFLYFLSFPIFLLSLINSFEYFFSFYFALYL